MQQNSATLPLAGVKVLDLTRVLAGPLCTMMLGDLGADVIKVERAGTGDESRGWGPPFHENGLSAYYICVNRNKKSLALDFNDSADREVVTALLGEADIVVDNFLPGALDRWGLSPGEWLRKLPRLVWCTITGFGEDSSRPGYDFVVQAEQGWMSITGEPDGAPLKTGVAFADIIAGKDAAVAVLAAHGATRGTASLPADSRRIIISLAHSATSALLNVAQNVLITGKDAGRYGNAHPNLVPYQLFQTADDPIVVAVGNDAQWRSCVEALGGLEDLASDPGLATNAGRVVNRERVISRIQTRLLGDVSKHWLESLSRAHVPCGRVRKVKEAVHEIGGSPVTGIPPSTPGGVRLPPPQLDEHGKEIREKGWRCFEVGPAVSGG